MQVFSAKFNAHVQRNMFVFMRMNKHTKCLQGYIGFVDLMLSVGK